MRPFIDQLGRTVAVPEAPKRIISLVPSQTELLADLGLDDEVVGLTRFCVHPDQWRFKKTRVGGTKDFKLDRIRDLRPDLIIANKEENELEGIEALASEFPVWISDVQNLSDALSMIESVGHLVNRPEKAAELIERIEGPFQALRAAQRDSVPVAYLIWKNPYMSVGGDTFIHAMLEEGGFANVFGEESRYPEVDLTDQRWQNAERIFLSSEPYPFKEEHMEELRRIAPQAHIELVDGELFSWYGSRLVKTPSYLRELGKK
ncbi:ABC transporter substrate-binding protein [Cryomorphaceae bacterium]|nr:ABC transporter substrate-binding protein [Cryomorphaceae bacterium]